MNTQILFKGKNKPAFYAGRNTGNVAPIWCYDVDEKTLELLPDVSRSTSGSFNFSDGRENKNLPTKKQIKHLLPENIDAAQMWVNWNGGKFIFADK